MVGSAMARDLARDWEVTAADIDPHALARLSQHGVRTKQADLGDPHILRDLVSETDLVVGAVPGFMGFQTLQTVIESKKPCVDISFFPEEASQLDVRARDQGIPVIVDAGVAPGMSNLILGRYAAEMQIRRARCYVGGLPRERRWPFAYKAPFSPIDVIEEYTRPARLKVNGKIVTRPALTEPEFLDFPGIGTLEAFNTDGLRSLLHTLEIPNLAEKTLRYPGHREQMQMLRSAGFFASNPIEVKGVSVAPLDVTATLLLKNWELTPGEAEFTVMRILLEGEAEGRPRKIQVDLEDEYDVDSGTSSMARTTGYACTAMANLLLQDRFSTPGVHPPETIGANPVCYESVMTYLQERGIEYRVQVNDGGQDE